MGEKKNFYKMIFFSCLSLLVPARLNDKLGAKDSHAGSQHATVILSRSFQNRKVL